MSCFELRLPTEDELDAFHNGLGRRASWFRVGLVDGKPVLTAGFLDLAERRWGWIDIIGDVGSHGPWIVRRIKRELRAQGGPIYCQLQPKFHTAARLLYLIGFRPTGETFNGLEVYKWGHLQHCSAV